MDNNRYNPYVFGPPVEDPAFFFGREHELKITLSTISQLAPGLRQSMAVVGPRRIGKSSLLLQLVRRLQSAPNAVALVSTEQFALPSPLMLAREILSALREGAQHKNLATAHVHFDLLDSPAPPEEEIFLVFRRDLKRLNDALASAKQPPAVLMIDEVEGLVEFGGLRVLGVFRDLAQSLPYVLFVVAGSDRLYQLINDNTSPFFNVFKTITITPLKEEDARAMIREPAGQAHICLDPDAVDDVVRISGGLPFLINMICHYATYIVLTEGHLAVTQEQVELACRHILTHEQGYFLDIWRRAQGLEKVVLYALAMADRPRPLADIASDVAEIIDFSQPIAQVRDLVTQLVQRQILRHTKDQCYSFTNQLVPIWLRENRTAPQVAEESLPPTVSSFSDDPDAERAFLEQLLRTHKDNLAFLQEQLRLSRSSDRMEKILSLVQKRIERTEQRINALSHVQVSVGDNARMHESAQVSISKAEEEKLKGMRNLEILRNAYVRRLQSLELQKATFGLNTPPYLLNEIDDLQEKIQQIDSTLRSLREYLNPSPQPLVTISDEEREQLQKLIRLLQRRLHQLELQRAQLGVSVHPAIVIELEDIRAKIEDFKRRLA